MTTDESASASAIPSPTSARRRARSHARNSRHAASRGFARPSGRSPGTIAPCRSGPGSRSSCCSCVAVLLGILVLLGRIRGGRYLRPVITFLSKVPLFKRWFQRASIAALERQNPELAAAMKKMQAFGEPKSPEQAQRMLNLLTPSERRAYMEAVGQEAEMPEATNRQLRRRMEYGGAGMPVTPSRRRTAPARPAARAARARRRSASRRRGRARRPPRASARRARGRRRRSSGS